MASKKSKFIALGLVSLFGLSACNDEIVAKPTGYDDAKIVTVEGYDEEIYHNLMNVIYDAIRDGSLGSDVLNKVLYQYSISIFGAYNKKVDGYVADTTTLEDAYKDITVSGENYTATKVAKNFVRDHKAYWDVDNDGKHVDASGNEITVKSDEDYNASESELARVVAKFENIEKRIAQKMYDSISSGSYSDRSLFYESRYIMSLRSSMKNVATLKELNDGIADASLVSHEGVLLDPDTEDYEVFDETKGFLNRSLFQSDKYSYVEDEIVPNIYNELLVEQYILDEQYNTLGRSYAREVEIVSIKTNEEYPLAARYLVSEFVKSYVLAEPLGDGGVAVNAVKDSTNKVDLNTFKLLSNAWKGVNLTAEEEQLVLDSEGFETKVIGTETVYLGTEYGDMMEDYAKIAEDPAITDTSIESDFTSSNTYPAEVGKEIKEREINLHDHTQNGWFIKNGGLSDLPSSIRDRLFNVGVANGLVEGNEEKAAAQDRWQYDNGAWSYEAPEDESRYVALINGVYYLKSDSAESTDKDMVHYDSSSKTYYIVRIKEASSVSKLSKVNDNRYSETRGLKVMEDFVNEICENVATNDTYKTLSTKHWLEEAALKYHDDVIYDYFKTNYPELFEQLIINNSKVTQKVAFLLSLLDK